MRTVWDIIKSPVITEKALVAKEETQDRRQLLTFRVDRRATKPEIKTAVETIFQVKVDEVRTAQYMGKMARRGRFEGRKPSWKKAFVTLKQGEKPVGPMTPSAWDSSTNNVLPCRLATSIRSASGARSPSMLNTPSVAMNPKR